jgi:hypothetical protein
MEQEIKPVVTADRDRDPEIRMASRLEGAIVDGAGTSSMISESELVGMLGFHLRASARRIAQLAGALQSPRLRARMLRTVGDLERAEQALRTTRIPASAAPARAGNFFVNATFDAGVCATRSGRGTVRAAFPEAQANPGADVVTLDTAEA